jgi:hypothetical protein
MNRAKKSTVDVPLAGYAKRFRALKRELARLGYFCKGTVLKRMMKCGQKQCACHRDPSKRHGPYFEWTYKVQGKTINLGLRPEVAPIYQSATHRYRTLKALLTRMERLSRTALARLAKNRLSDSRST